MAAPLMMPHERGRSRPHLCNWPYPSEELRVAIEIQPIDKLASIPDEFVGQSM
jgi:hypothetical protein